MQMEADPRNSILLDLGLELTAEHHQRLDNVLEELLAQVTEELGPLQRKAQRDILGMMLANLVRANQIDPSTFVAISLDAGAYTKNRYIPEGVGGYRLIKRAFDFLKENKAYTDYRPGFRDRTTGIGYLSRIRALTPLLTRLTMKEGSQSNSSLITHNILLSPLSVRSKLNQECILLKDENKKLIDYVDNEVTSRMRSRLREWNAFLDQQWVDLYLPDAQLHSGVDLTADDPDILDAWSEAGEEVSKSIDLTRRRLYRVFNNGSFEQGGRFYGGWWQTLPSRHRAFLTINWHPCREVDFSNMQAAMLYAWVRRPLEGDAYSLDGIDAGYRKLLKRTFFKLVNATGRMRAPAREELPPGWTWEAILGAMRAKHAPIAQYLQSGIRIKSRKSTQTLQRM
jgi:hypothetical protein